MLTFVKIGGSLITDKNRERSFLEVVMNRLAQEFAEAFQANSDQQLIIGHGSGSFGHFAASRHRTIEGVHSPDEWKAFASVGIVASELNYLVARALSKVQLPILRIQPSASLVSHGGEVIEMSLEPLRSALDHGLIPIVHGDVAFDHIRGGTIISTEKLFFYMAKFLPVSQILLLGTVDGVYDLEGKVIRSITPQNIDQIESALGGSGGIDVTGGMESKVREMLALAEMRPKLTIRIMNGMQPDLLRDTLLGRDAPGTVISAHN